MRVCLHNFEGPGANPLSEAKHLQFTAGGRTTEIVVPNSETIGSNAFKGCTAVESLKVARKEPAQASEDSFDTAMYQNTKLLVPEDGETPYRDADVWRNFNNIEAYAVPHPAISIEPDAIDLTEGLHKGIYIVRQGDKTTKIKK